MIVSNIITNNLPLLVIITLVIGSNSTPIVLLLYVGDIQNWLGKTAMTSNYTTCII